MKLLRLIILCLILIPAAIPANAQFFGRSPGAPGDDPSNDGGPPETSGGRGAVDAPDSGSLAIRLSKLEGRIRDMTGQVEELQNANRKLVEQVQKFQADIEARLASGPAARQKRADVAPAPKAGAVEDGPAMDADGLTPRPRKSRRDDAFDPDAAPVDAPGKPKALGSMAAGPSGAGDSGPMDLSGGKLNRGVPGAETLAPTLRLPSTTPKEQSGGSVASAGAVGAGTAPAITSSRADFDTALGFYRDKQYEDAEKGFTAFIQKNPKSKLAADATYYLGESFAQRGRSREAAEQYLKISTEYANSSRAPDAMLHLGISLKALGAKEQACATFSEVERKYPNAPGYIRSGVEREAKRAQC